MPQKPAVSTAEIYDVLRHLPIFDDNGKLKTRSHKVWTEALSKLVGKPANSSTYHSLSDNSRSKGKGDGDGGGGAGIHLPELAIHCLCTDI